MNLHILEKVRFDNRIEKKNEMAKRLHISKSLYSMIIHEQLPVSRRVAIEVHSQFALLCPQVQNVATGTNDAI